MAREQAFPAAALVRHLLVAGLLALAWLVFGAAAANAADDELAGVPHPGSLASTPLTPVVERVVAPVKPANLSVPLAAPDAVPQVVRPATESVADTAVKPLAPAVAAVRPVVEQVPVAEVVQAVEPVAEPLVATAVSPIADTVAVVQPVVAPITEVVQPVVEPVIEPVVQPAVEAADNVVSAVPAVNGLAGETPVQTITQPVLDTVVSAVPEAVAVLPDLLPVVPAPAVGSPAAAVPVQGEANDAGVPAAVVDGTVPVAAGGDVPAAAPAAESAAPAVLPAAPAAPVAAGALFPTAPSSGLPAVDAPANDHAPDAPAPDAPAAPSAPAPRGAHTAESGQGPAADLSHAALVPASALVGSGQNPNWTLPASLSRDPGSSPD